MRTRSTILALVLTFALLAASPAAAWDADFFEKDASGNATYEEMAISPEAVFDRGAGAQGRTILTYQGAGLDPYVMSYDHATGAWAGPYRIAGNDLKGDTHGGPSLVIDPNGYYYVFFGGHGGGLGHARSAAPNDISAWVDLGNVRVGPNQTQISATYPQAVIRNDGALALYYRRDDKSSNDPTNPGDSRFTTKGDWESIVSTATAPAAPAWVEPPQMIINGDYAVAPGAYPASFEESKTAPYYWYANVEDSGDGLPRLAAVRRDYVEDKDDPYVRTGVYYLEKHSAEPTWTSAGGLEIDPRLRFKDLEATAAVLPEAEGGYTNQVVLRTDRGTGRPAVLYLWGKHDGSPYEWRFARWDGDSWLTTKIAETDNFFDAGTFEFTPDGNVEAFLTTGGVPDDQWRNDPATPLDEGRYDTRGGDISRWMSSDGGASWDELAPVIESPGAHARYNNPQIVRNDDGEARLLFSEWNNDASNYIHKVYLWGDEGFKQRSFTPEIVRLAGANRIATAVEISKQGFPAGATTAVLASAANFPDVLCGVPLAQAYRAPVLLTNKDTLDPALKAELQRLGVSQVVVLGGEGAVAKSVETAVRGIKNNGSFVKTTRIQGRDRYVTSSEIAKKLAEVRKAPPAKVVLASGENFADALAVSPYAARRGYPVLLTPRASVNTTIAATINTFAPEEMIVVGGNAAVDPIAEDGYEAAASTSATRWAGSNRYATARIIAEHAIDESGHSLERFSLATGENWADAVGGGLFAARMNSVMVTTPSTWLHGEAVQLLSQRAFRPGTGVLEAYILGGPAAVSPAVENALAAELSYLDDKASSSP